MTVALILSILASASARGDEPPPPHLDVGMRVTVAADGSVASVVPEPGLPFGLGDAMVARVSQWHYTPATWHGKPVAVQDWLSLRLQAMPVEGGGLAFSIAGRGRKPDPLATMPVPEFPRSALRAHVDATLVYRVHVDKDGTLTMIGRRFPAVVKGHLESLDESARRAIAASRWVPFTADGVTVACDVDFPIQFTTGGTAPAVPELPTYENECPRAKLEPGYLR